MLLTIVVIVGFILLFIGLIGCIIPAIPGPPLSFLALLLIAIVQGFAEPLTPKFMVLMAVITIIVTVLDYVIPVAGAKKYGSSKWGIFGSIGGMIIGILFFPPLGIIIGAFLGAVVVEMMVGKEGKDALRAGWGVFMGTLLGTILKLTVSFMLTYYFIHALV
ncbi:hypothetical protein B6I21_06660 [candidate division KSB1 bacterium 4572_119]|nr:MAG: hypothetical protein B6I21_06660 [candidate division KSB1 bacterium 4572_119]